MRVGLLPHQFQPVDAILGLEPDRPAQSRDGGLAVQRARAEHAVVPDGARVVRQQGGGALRGLDGGGRVVGGELELGEAQEDVALARQQAGGILEPGDGLGEPALGSVKVAERRVVHGGGLLVARVDEAGARRPPPEPEGGARKENKAEQEGDQTAPGAGAARVGTWAGHSARKKRPDRVRALPKVRGEITACLAA